MNTDPKFVELTADDVVRILRSVYFKYRPGCPLMTLLVTAVKWLEIPNLVEHCIPRRGQRRHVLFCFCDSFVNTRPKTRLTKWVRLDAFFFFFFLILASRDKDTRNNIFASRRNKTSTRPNRRASDHRYVPKTPPIFTSVEVKRLPSYPPAPRRVSSGADSYIL